MFDLIATGHRTTGPRGIVPLVLSSAVHVLAIGAVAVPLLFATDQLPVIRDEALTFVRVAPPPPPPPPAPAPAAPTPTVTRPTPARRPTPRPQETVPVPARPAPVEEPAAIEPPAFDGEDIFTSFDGVPGGVVGGVPGGVIGGVVGGLPEAPPPPPPPAPRAPIRTGGQIQPPALIKRVAPVYPPLAASANIEGVVILEATVGRDGRVEDVQVLRSVPLLDKAAVDAVRQWQYEPLLLNGRPERFILTVTVGFSLS